MCEEHLTVEELKLRREACMEASARAVREKPCQYRQIRGLLCRVVSLPVDVDDYSRLARTLAGLLGEMGPGTIFRETFEESLNSTRMGRARYFRAECRELLDQLDALEEWRRLNRPLRLVK